MQNFSQILQESRKTRKDETYVVTSAEIEEYVNKLKRQLPKEVQAVIYLTDKYGILSRETLEDILNASSGELKSMADKMSLDIAVLTDLQKQLQALKNNIRLLPQYQSQAERDAIKAGRIIASDLTLDFESERGRNMIAKMYTPIVHKIANQYKGSSSLDYAALVSAGMLGLAEAIKDFDPDKTDKPFKTYAAYKIQQAILDDMNELSHSLSGTNWYATKKYGDKLDAVSIDSLLGKDDDEYNIDHLAALGVTDDHRWIDITKDEREYWDDLYKLIDKKFTVRECNIFYRFFGLKDFWGKKEKSKDIAKSYGMSEGNIRNSIINKMLKYLLQDPKAREILDTLRTIYDVSLMRECIYFTDKQAIYETLISDDMFILLEELTKWNSSKVFKNSISNALNNLSAEDALYMIRCLNEGFSFVDTSYKKHKNIIITFLRYLYPTENFARLSDVSIIEYVVELSNISKEYKIQW